MKFNCLCQLLAIAFVVCAGAAEPLVPAPQREVLDVSLLPPVIITAPGPEFQDEARHGAMILGMDRTPKGRIWGCWTGNGDKPDAYFILATSDDGGTTWSKPRLVVGAADPSGKPQRRALVGNVWTDPLGRVWLFFDQSLVGFFDGRAGNWYIRCDNPDGAEPVWSKPVRIADGCTLGKPTVLKNGDWLLPVSLWTREKINPLKFGEAYRELDPLRMANVFVSTDQGKTWTRRGGVAFPETDFDEHMIVELRDGRLWMLARTKYGMAESFSSDQGRTWTEPKPSAIQNVSARFFIRRLASGRLLLVKNGPTTERLPKRSHMSAFLSDDDGKTWRGGLLLDERASVSYPDGFQAPDGLIHILYDWNRHTDAEILMAKFREEDVLAGKFVSPDAKPRFLVNKALGPKPKPARARIILDTDMSGDCDDAGTLALLHALADRGECELLAVVTNRKDKTNASAAAVDAINTYYGRSNIPIGTDKVGPTDLQRTSTYTRALRDGFPHDAKPDDQMPDALDVYRRVLAAQPDDSVTICSVGAFSNLAELWRREPALVMTKVRRLVVMGGEFPKSKRPETNVRTHREAARVVAAEWPTELVWHGWEVGNVLITGAALKKTPKNNPVRRAYELKPFGKRPAIEGGQPSWDQGAALYAVRGAEPEFWRTVRGGRVLVDEEGVTTWEAGPITRHYYAKIKGEPAKLAAVIESLMVQPPKQRASATKPNVIIVLTDDQGYGDLSCHGNPILKTPHLDRLHAESVRFTDFHAAPMCTPTRGQLMSGLDCLRNGAMNVSSGRVFLRRGLPTMADVFAAGSYRCGQFGKWHLGDNYPYRPHDRGFHEAVYYPSSHIGSAPDFWNNHYFDDTYYHNGRCEKFHGYTTDVFFNEAMKWMRAQAAAKKPFFCYIPTAAAHGPLFVPQKYRDLYKDQKPNVASFFGMIANIDENMGRLEEFLRATGLHDNTIIIFMTDNGGTVGVPVFNAGMKGSKVTLWEGGHRVPCFIRWPGGKLCAPGDVADLTQMQDILPTLADLCALPTPPNARFDGTNLAPLLRGKTSALPDRMLVINYSRMGNQVPAKQGAAVLWKRWRLLQGRELYDLTTDPQQKQNVIEKFPEVAAKMRAHLDAWWRGIEPTINNFGAVIIGNDAENPSQLSPSDWQDSFLDQGRQVREGLRRNGAWNVIVERADDYEFELRRWPREADAPMSASLPAHKHADGEFPPGVPLPIVKARLKIGGFDESRAVAAANKAVTFTAKLKPGRTQLQTWFYDADGRELCGAYYVYVRRK